MRFVKMLGLLAVVAAAAMAFAATASATVLTSSAGGAKVEKGATIHATSEGTTTLDGPAAISCAQSTVKGKVANEGGTNITVSGGIEELTFEGCNQHVTVKTKGELLIHTKTEAADGNGILTSNGAEVQVVLTGLGIECIYSTTNTPIGTLTGSAKLKGSTATLDIESSPIPRTGGSIFCGGSAKWTGSYSVSTPDYLDVD